MKYTTYDPTTGKILGIYSVKDGTPIPPGESYILGNYFGDNLYVDGGQVVTMPLKPDDGKKYEFNYTTKTWNFIEDSIDDLVNSIRFERGKRLTLLDNISAVRFSTLTPEQQLELQTYRQALLDVPQQSGFPQSVSWPTVPSWLQ